MKTSIIILFMCYASVLIAQTPYVDVLTAPAMIGMGSALSSQQNKTNNNLSAIQRTQVLIEGQLFAANNLQQKIVDGLTQVSAALYDAYLVKDIYSNCEMIVSFSTEITRFAAQNPQFSIFAANSVKQFRNRSVQLSADVTKILTGGTANMMNAGQRRELLRSLNTKTSLLASDAFYILHEMQSAKMAGFWKSINPFKSYIEQDARLMRQIIAQANAL